MAGNSKQKRQTAARKDKQRARRDREALVAKAMRYEGGPRTPAAAESWSTERLRGVIARGKLKPFRPEPLAGIAMAAMLVDGKK